MSASGTAPAPSPTDAELKPLQALVDQECGMHRRAAHELPAGPAVAWAEGAPRRLSDTYHRPPISQQGKEELAKLLENLTVNETSFFRHKAQLDLFQKTVIEELFKQKGAAPGVLDPHMERGLLDRPGSVHPGHAGDRRAGLLLPAQSAAHGDAAAQAADSAAVAGGNSGLGYQLLRAARTGRKARTARTRCRWSTTATACAISTKWAERYAIRSR